MVARATPRRRSSTVENAVRNDRSTVIFLRGKRTWGKLEERQRGRLKYRKKVFTRSRNYSWVVIPVSPFSLLCIVPSASRRRLRISPLFPSLRSLNLPLTDSCKKFPAEGIKFVGSSPPNDCPRRNENNKCTRATRGYFSPRRVTPPRFRFLRVKFYFSDGLVRIYTIRLCDLDSLSPS